MPKPAPRKARNVDDESGMNRTKSRTQPRNGKPPPPKYSVDTEEESAGSQTDTSEEEFAGKHYKDDSRRKVKEKKPVSRRNKNVRPVNNAQEQDASDVDEPQKSETTTSDHTNFQLAMAYRTGFTVISFTTESQYIPDVSALFTVLHHMTGVLSENTLLHEVIPAYHTVAINTFYAHAVFFQILRVRGDANLLSRVERRALRRYESVGPLESWEIATPLIGYFQALGRIVPEGGKYGQIVPRFPDYDNLAHATTRGLARIEHIHGVARLPIMPALHTFLRNLGTGTATYIDGTLFPTTTATLAAPVSFMGITASTAATANFQTLAVSAGWKQPQESGVETYNMINDQKKANIARWKIPEFAATKNIVDIETFLGLDDAMSVSWMRALLRMSSSFNNFFPGSVSLANIPPITRIETVCHITAYPRRAINRLTPADDTWYHQREGWVLDLQGSDLRPDAQAQYQIAMTVTTRLTYDTTLLPAATVPVAAFSSLADGDYFDATTSPRVELECHKQPDPIEQAPAIIESKMYDNLGGRAK